MVFYVPDIDKDTIIYKILPVLTHSSYTLHKD